MTISGRLKNSAFILDGKHKKYYTGKEQNIPKMCEMSGEIFRMAGKKGLYGVYLSGKRAEISYQCP